jgi:acyl dehydratase
VGYYFEDFNIKDEFVTSRRTVTETDIIMFAALTGDNNPLHTDQVFAQETQFGGRIAHGLLGASIAVGLWCRLGLVDGTALAFLSTQWKFVNPVKLGDTIHAKLTITNKKETSKQGRGIIFIHFNVQNQDGVQVQDGEMVLMVAAKSN